MPDYTGSSNSRLKQWASLNIEQQHVVEQLFNSDGICICGRTIEKNHDKLVMAQVQTSWFPVEAWRNTIVFGLYCVLCANRIHACFKGLKTSQQPDKVIRLDS